MSEPMDLGPTFVSTPKGDELVIMTRTSYDRLVAEATRRADLSVGDPIEDERASHLALKRRAEWLSAGKPAVPLTVLRRVRAGESYIRAFRAERGFTQAELAKKAGIAQGYLSEIENTRKTPNEETRGKLARALDVHPLFLSDAAPGVSSDDAVDFSAA